MTDNTQVSLEEEVYKLKQDIRRKDSYGYIEDPNSATEVRNLDLFDTISPLWYNRDKMSIIERSLLQCILVLNNKITCLQKETIEMNNKITCLQKETIEMNNKITCLQKENTKLEDRIDDLE